MLVTFVIFTVYKLRYSAHGALVYFQMRYLAHIINEFAVWLLLLCLVSVISTQKLHHDVERYTEDMNLKQPTIAKNIFRNQNLGCFFSYCWNKKADCSISKKQCCWCRCRSGRTFFSQSKDCLTASQISATSGKYITTISFFYKQQNIIIIIVFLISFFEIIVQ